MEIWVSLKMEMGISITLTGISLQRTTAAPFASMPSAFHAGLPVHTGFAVINSSFRAPLI